MRVEVMENLAEWEKTLNLDVQTLNAHGLNTLAFEARKVVQAEIKAVFKNPKPITIRSVLVWKADPEMPIARQFAEVYINDHVPGATTQPDKYLGVQESGGQRQAKRAERALAAMGFLPPGGQFVPGPGAVLDQWGQLKGGPVEQMLSRLGAAEQTAGFTANASEATKKKLRKKGVAVKSTGTDYFVGKTKSGTRGVFQLVSKGKIAPVLWFTKAQSYTPRFPFREIVNRVCAERMIECYAKAARFLSHKQ